MNPVDPRPVAAERGPDAAESGPGAAQPGTVPGTAQPGTVPAPSGPAPRPPAPGNLCLVQDFVNSADLELGTDALATPDKAAGWLCQHELCPDPLSLSWADRERLIALREALRALLHANTGDPLDAGAAALVEAEAGRLPLGMRVGQGSVTVAPCRGGFEGAMAAILAGVAQAAGEGTWRRLKACRDRGCGWAFYDHSRNASGVWCRMSECGNRAKARRFRDRHSHRSADA